MLYENFKLYRGHYKSHNAAFSLSNILTYFLVDVDETYIGGIIYRRGEWIGFNQSHWPILTSLGIKDRIIVPFTTPLHQTLQMMMAEVSDTLQHKTIQFMTPGGLMLNQEENQRVLTFSKYLDGKTREMICVPTKVFTDARYDLFKAFSITALPSIQQLGVVVMYEDAHHSGPYTLRYFDSDGYSRQIVLPHFDDDEHLKRFYLRVSLMKFLVKTIETIEHLEQYKPS